MTEAVLTAYRRELRKLAAQKRTWLGIAAAALTPVVFLVSIQISKVTPHDGPYDTPLGPNLRHTGPAIDLVVLRLIAVVGPAVVAALVAGTSSRARTWRLLAPPLRLGATRHPARGTSTGLTRG